MGTVPFEAGPVYWKMPIPPSLIFFIDSAERFSIFTIVLKRSYLVGLDAEWKPLTSLVASKGKNTLKVSILQIACRFKNLNVSDDINGTQGSDNSELELDRDLWDVLLRSASDEGLEENKFDDWLKSVKNVISKKTTSAVFVLDMLALSPEVFAGPLAAMLQSRSILKLGYGLRDDMRFLAANNSGLRTFDEVEPYVDVGRMYRNIRFDKGFDKAKGKAHGRPSSIVGGGLSGVVQSVLGYPLCKELQCSNWEERPLSLKQLEYAASDAFCLMDVFDQLSHEVGHPTPCVTEVSRGLTDFLYSYGRDSQHSSEVNPQHTIQAMQTLSINPTETLAVEVPISITTAGLVLARRSIQTESLLSVCRLQEGTAGVVEDQSTCGGCSDVFVEMGKDNGGEEEFSRQVSFLEGTEAWSLTWKLAVNNFGEKLDVHETIRMKQTGKSRRRRGVAQGGKLNQMEDILDWIGPAPWEASSGGDGRPKFICDIMVEGLAKQLRCVGIDAESRSPKMNDVRKMLEQAEMEGRVILTRDIKVVRMRMSRQLAYRVNNFNKQEQLKEIIKVFRLEILKEQLLTRCIRCNGVFTPTPLSASEARAAALWTQSLPPCVLENVSEFWQCSVCRHLYWEGSQFDRALQQFAAVCSVNSQESSAKSVEQRIERSGGRSLSSCDLEDDSMNLDTTPKSGTTLSSSREKINKVSHEQEGKAGHGKGKMHICGCKRSSQKVKASI